MSYVDSEHKKLYVITYKELAFMAIVFSTILFVLYPKDIIKEQILSENSNYDLSMLYLTNLLQHDPNNESLMLVLAEQSLRSGKKDLALRLLKLLHNSKNIEYRNKATILSYELEKDDYFYFKTKERKSKQKKRLRELFSHIFYKNMYDPNEIDKWYKEALFLQEDKEVYYFLKLKLKKEPRNIHLLENAYYLSIKLSHLNDSLKYIESLIKYDKKRKEKWLMNKYYMLIKYRLYDKAETFLLQQMKYSDKWKIKMADFYLMRKEYLKSSEIYMKLFVSTKKYSLKRKYFFKAVEILQAGEHFEKAVKLAHRYESYFIDDKKVRKFLLKIYMATGHLDYAANLSKKILKREHF
jgi:hypothetical protein